MAMARQKFERLDAHNLAAPLVREVVFLGEDNSAAFTRHLLIAEKGLRCTKAQIVSDTNVSADATNWWNVSISGLTGPNVIATTDTETGEGGALTANTPRDLTLGAVVTNRDLTDGEVCAITFTPENAASGADLSAVRFLVHLEFQPK